jgi:hypothetical protein
MENVMSTSMHSRVGLTARPIFKVEPVRLADWDVPVCALVPTKPIIKTAKSMLDEAQVDLEAKSVRLAYVLAGRCDIALPLRQRSIAAARRDVWEAESRLATIHALSTGQNVVDWERVVTPEEWVDIIVYFGGTDADVDGGVDHV